MTMEQLRVAQPSWLCQNLGVKGHFWAQLFSDPARVLRDVGSDNLVTVSGQEVLGAPSSQGAVPRCLGTRARPEAGEQRPWGGGLGWHGVPVPRTGGRSVRALPFPCWQLALALAPGFWWDKSA